MDSSKGAINIGFRLNLWGTFLLGEKCMKSSDNVGVGPLEELNFMSESGGGKCTESHSTMYTALFSNSTTRTHIIPPMGSGLDFSAAVIYTSDHEGEGAVGHIPVRIPRPLILIPGGGYCYVGYLTLTITTKKATYIP